MKFLTLTQPWCGLVASGIKLIECRTRPVIGSRDLGTPICLHAGRRPGRRVEERIYDQIRAIEPSLFSSGGPRRSRWHRLSCIASATIAVAVVERAVIWRDSDPRSMSLVDYHTGEDVDLLTLGDQLRWFMYGIGYVLRPLPVVLPVPVRHPGARGLRILTRELAAEVLAQLERAGQLHSVGHRWYLRRDDNRSRFDLGSGVGHWEHLLGHGALTVLAPDREVEFAAELADELLAERLRIRGSHPSGARVMPPVDVEARRLARAIILWSEGRPFRFVDEDGFDDWADPSLSSSRVDSHGVSS